jgi:hypothetical protein
MSVWNIAAKRDEHRRLWTMVTWAELARFIGPNAHRFEPTWATMNERITEGRSHLVRSWSWPAFLAPFPWFFYRKQWGIGATILILPIMLGFLLPGAPASATTGAFLFLAMQAKALYLDASVRQIAKIKEASMSAYAADAALERRGGVSTLAAIISGTVLALGFAVVLLPLFHSVGHTA